MPIKVVWSLHMQDGKSLKDEKELEKEGSLKSSKDDEMLKEVEWSLHIQHGKLARDEEEVEADVQMGLNAAKVFSVSIASIITYVILVHLQESVLSMELTYR